jgi:hypothetical protein
MPTSSERLRKKFMVDGSDGIIEAEDIIIKAGGTIKDGLIDPPSECDDGDELFDAMEYLIYEWDYALESDQ